MKKKKSKVSKKLTTEDLENGFVTIEPNNNEKSEIDKYKRRLGLAPGERLLYTAE